MASEDSGAPKGRGKAAGQRQASATLATSRRRGRSKRSPGGWRSVDARIDELGALSENREAEWRRLIKKRDSRIATMAKRIMVRDRTAAEARSEADEAKAATARTERQLEEMRQSSSWRLTAPLRAITDFRRRRNKPPEKKPRQAPSKPPPPPVERPPLPDSEWEIGMMKTPRFAAASAASGAVAVFTAVVGGYDTVREPTVIDPTADYYLFTDAPVPAGSVWQQRDFDFEAADPTRMARYVKTHAHRYFPDHDWSMWIDGNLRLATLPEDFISEENTDADIIAWHHGERDCVYDEFEECVALKKDDEALMRRQIAELRASGYPEHNGLITTSVLVFRHRRPAVAALLDDWWRAIETGSRRDQLSFNPTLYRHPEIKLGYLAPPGVEMHNDPRVLYAHHRPAKGNDEPAPTEMADQE